MMKKSLREVSSFTNLSQYAKVFSKAFADRFPGFTRKFQALLSYLKYDN
jgi:hypothetical protein